MLNQKLAIGFDTLVATDSVNNQIYPFHAVTDNVAVVAGRGSGQALQFTQSGMLTYSPDANRVGQWGVACGCAINYSQLAQSEIALICGAFYTDTVGTLAELLATDEYTALIIKSGNVWLYEKTKGVLREFEITSHPQNSWMYFEFRTSTIAYTGSQYATQAWAHGVLLSSMSSTARANMPLTLVYAAAQSGVIAIDDVYTYVTENYPNHVILASAKVKCLPLTEVVESTWTGENQLAALSDLDDSTIISSDAAATARFKISSDTQEVHAVNYHVRASSQDSAGTVQINAGRIINTAETLKTNLGATEQPRTHIVRNPASPYGTWNQALETGATLILRT